MGPLSGVRDSGHCLINFVRLGNKEFYIDEPFEELSTSEAVDGRLPC